MRTQTAPPASAVHQILNSLIGDFWRGTVQHQTHVAVLQSLGIAGLAEQMTSRISDEPDTVRKLSERLLELGGTPAFAISAPAIGRSLKEVLELDLAVQTQARPVLNAAAEAVAEAHDAVTRQLIEDILVDEEEHLSWLQNECSLLDRLGEPLYLSRRL